jgi:two-component system, NtrC family, sensor histidine kinase HydH
VKNPRREAIKAAPGLLRPGYLAALAGVLALVLGALAWYSLRESRRAAFERLETGATSLALAVARAGENSLRADAEIELLVVERLLDNARLVRDIEGRRGLQDSLLARLAIENDLFEIIVFDAQGGVTASSAGADPGWNWAGPLEGLLEGSEDETVFGFDIDQLYAVAVRRQSGGAIVVRADAAWMLELRRTSGTGRLIQELGANPEIAYMVLQDTLGILSAPPWIEQMGRISGDPFLEQAYATDAPLSRTLAYGDGEVFETALAFTAEGERIGLLRIGLSIDDLEAAEERTLLQLVLLAFLLALLGAVGAGVLTVRQNYALLDDAYGRIQTYSSRVLAQMADAVVALDAQGRVEVLNEAAARLFGADADTARGRPYTEILGGGIEAVDRLLAGGGEAREEVGRLQLPGGRELVLAVSTSLLHDAVGAPETVVAVLHDLTEKEALETNLRRQERLASMGALASGVAHEVRNPLNAIGLIVQRLKREFVPQADAQEYEGLISTVRDEVARVNRIVVDFLELARPPALRPRRVNLEELLGRSMQVAAAQANAKGLEVRTNFSGVGSIQADPEQLEQALLNLLGNAVQATEAGTISLGACAAGDGLVEIVVEDTGAGIKPQDLERIFDLYFTTKASGTGLGLALVHRIVTQHGGRVEVHSKVGDGTRFVVQLPREGPQVQQAHQAQEIQQA